MHVTPELVAWAAVIALFLGSAVTFISMCRRAPMDTDLWPGGEPRWTDTDSHQ